MNTPKIMLVAERAYAQAALSVMFMVLAMYVPSAPANPPSSQPSGNDSTHSARPDQELIISLLRKSDRAHQFRGLHEVMKLSPSERQSPEIQSLIGRLAESDSEEVANAAAYVLYQLPSPQAAPVLERAARGTQRLRQFYGAAGLLNLPNPSPEQIGLGIDRLLVLVRRASEVDIAAMPEDRRALEADIVSSSSDALRETARKAGKERDYPSQAPVAEPKTGEERAALIKARVDELVAWWQKNGEEVIHGLQRPGPPPRP